MTRMRCVASLILVALALSVGTRRVGAQGWVPEWTSPRNLSNSPTSSNWPAIVADTAGNVHVVWAEDVGGVSVLGIREALQSSTTNTLLYTRWDGSSWSDPNDIIIVPGDDFAGYPSMAVDSRQYLHLVWTGMTTIYYSRAPAREAGSAQAWMAPVPVGQSARTQWESAIAMDNQDVPHILYATRDDSAVYYTRVTAEGQISDNPVRLSPRLVRPDEAALMNISLKIDRKGRMHAVWSTVGPDGWGQAIYYVRSLDGGETWSEAIRLAQGRKPESAAGEPSLGIVGESELHLIYVYPANMGRTERISRDAGETWGEPYTIYPDLEGIAGLNVQVTDSAANLHVLSNMRTHQQVGGLIYWQWLGDRWSPWQWANIETEATGLGGHFTAATVRLGNEIHVLWNTNFSTQTGEVWHTSGVVPGVAAQTPAPTPLAPTPTAQPRQSPTAPVAQERPTVSSESEAQAPIPIPGGYLHTVSSQLVAILIGALPAMLLILGAIAARGMRRRG